MISLTMERPGSLVIGQDKHDIRAHHCLDRKGQTENLDQHETDEESQHTLIVLITS
jgi:hypothetical protein